MNCRDVKTALYRRHPATERQINYGSGPDTIFVGAWTVLEEYRQIDVLALAAHSNPRNGLPGVRYPRIGYEVKVSRGDYRGELLNPSKRRDAVEWCHAFYFAVPFGLLKPEEIAFEEPAEFGDPAAFRREHCPAVCTRGRKFNRATFEYERCRECGGRGFLERSLVERVAPTLWVPADVGLVEVDSRGCRVVRDAPRSRTVPDIDSVELAKIVRHVSARPDPRHASLTDGVALHREAREALAETETEEVPA